MSVPLPPTPPQVIIRKAPPQSPTVGHDQALINQAAALPRTNAAGIVKRSEYISEYIDCSASEGSNPGKDWLSYESVYNHVKVKCYNTSWSNLESDG
jgi:hypothetical protein